MTDESYHTLLSVEAVAMTKSFRGLNIIVPEFNLIKYMKNMQTNYHNELDKIVVLLGTATVSELFISDYLKLLSSDYTIQPINRLTVDTHRIDELAHAGIFKRLICIIYQCLPIAQQQLFIMILRNATKWFADPELEIWSSILEQLGINYYPQIISECRFINAHKFKIDYSAIDRLVLELISNKQIA